MAPPLHMKKISISKIDLYAIWNQKNLKAENDPHWPPTSLRWNFPLFFGTLPLHELKPKNVRIWEFSFMIQPTNHSTQHIFVYLRIIKSSWNTLPYFNIPWTKLIIAMLCSSDKSSIHSMFEKERENSNKVNEIKVKINKMCLCKMLMYVSQPT